MNDKSVRLLILDNRFESEPILVNYPEIRNDARVAMVGEGTMRILSLGDIQDAFAEVIRPLPQIALPPIWNGGNRHERRAAKAQARKARKWR